MSAAQPLHAEEPVPSLAPRVARPQVRLQARGPVLPGALYVPRPVDAALFASLRRGESTVVLGPAGSGKSSLLARAASALSDRGRCVQLDLGALGGSTPTAVQHELVSAVARALAVPLAPFLSRTEGLAPGERLQRLLADEAESSLLLFVDGMEELRELFSRDIDSTPRPPGPARDYGAHELR
jgi:ATP/maltotriose-dependent transcriptional regulator MalT